MTVMCLRIPPLARLTHYPEMTPVGFTFPPLPADRGVAVPFTIDDSFFDTFGGIPDCSVSFLSRAGAWSARTSHSGFVPTWALAQLSGDPDQALKPLISAGIVRRVRNGIRIAEGIGLTVVNVSDVLRDIEREDAAAAEQRKAWRIKKRGQRREKIAERRGHIAAGVPGTSPEENVNVPPDSPEKRKKPQVGGNNVPGDIAGTSPGTHQIDRSNQSSSWVGQINAGAREAPDSAIITLVMDLAAKKAGRITSGAEARRAIAVWDKRAEDAGKVIHDRAKFYETCAKRERDIEAVLAPPPNPLWVELGTAPEPVPGGHLYEPDPSPFADSCSRPGCGLPKKNAHHTNQEANTG